MTQPEAVLLSLLGPRPVFFKHPDFPDILAAWNGMVMTQKHALMLAMEKFWGSGPTPEMKKAADHNLFWLYKAGAFENSESWNDIIIREVPTSNMYQWYRRKLTPFFNRELVNHKPDEIFRWFNLKEWSTN